MIGISGTAYVYIYRAVCACGTLTKLEAYLGGVLTISSIHPQIEIAESWRVLGG